MVEGDGLENRCILMGTEGSNPSLSAIFMLKFRVFPRFFPIELVKQSFVCYIVP